MGIVTAILGITLFLLLVFILSLLSRINLLSRQIDTVRQVLDESDERLRGIARLISQSSHGNKPPKL